MTLSRSSELKRTPMKRKGPKPKKCVICGEQFEPKRTGQKVCCPVPCGIEHARQAQAKAEAKAARARKAKTKAELEALKSNGQRKREATKRAQAAFNAFVRERDHDQPCISCGTTNPGGDPRGGVWDCGHYRTTGAAPELRFDEDNAHRQCKKCNRDQSGNVVEYRLRLIDRIGIERVERLEGPHELPHWTPEDLDAIAADYRRRAREMQRGRTDV